MKMLPLIAITFTLATAATAQRPLPPLDVDKQLGADAEAEILADPKTYPILPRKGNESAYNYLEKIMSNILRSGKVTHAKDFVWKLHIINYPNIINAFATPGGYIYVYTGLIHYLDNEAQLAGVIAHEIAHADRRHSVQKIGKEALGRLAKRRHSVEGSRVLEQLRSLRYSRTQESDADEYSVIYICSTSYHAPSITGFFEKMAAEGGRQRPQFLGTHPDNDNRVEAMNAKIKEIGSTGSVINESGHEKIKATLPNAATNIVPSERPRRRLPKNRGRSRLIR